MSKYDHVTGEWTPKEDDTARKAWADGVSIPDIARRLARPVHQTRLRLRVLLGVEKLPSRTSLTRRPSTKPKPKRRVRWGWAGGPAEW